jgi:hypothetical protein
MKKSFILLTSLTLLALVSLANIVFAQALPGPSDVITPPPPTAAAVDMILCSGQNITMTGPQDINNTNFAVYNWYKVDPSGNNQLTTVTSRNYNETPTVPGYYNYVLVTQNANGCLSPVSSVFKVFVLPPITAAVTTPNNTICVGAGSTVLTATATVSTGYTFNYQWTLNGANIPGATSSTYTVTGQSLGASASYGVNMSYVISPGCVGSATTQIIMTPLPTKPIIIAN